MKSLGPFCKILINIIKSKKSGIKLKPKKLVIYPVKQYEKVQIATTILSKVNFELFLYTKLSKKILNSKT